MTRLYFKLQTFALLLLLLATACGDDDKVTDTGVCFQFTEGELVAEMGITFDASCSKQPFQYYAWDFGDGEIDTGMEVTHTYGEAGKYTVVLSVSTDGTTYSSTQKTIEVLPSPFIKHCDDIDGDEVWEEGMHLVECTITVNGSLTIKPGASIYMGSQKSLDIHGKLIAQGTASKPIKFIPADNSTTPGAWGHINFFSTASAESAIDYCQLSYGGKGSSFYYPGFEYYSSYGVIHLQDCEVSVTNTTVEGAAAYGVALTEEAKFASFENNTFTGSTKNPVSIHATALHTLGGTSTFSGEKDILVIGDEYLNTGGDVTWYKQDVPYLIDGSIGLSGGHNITIEAGTVLHLDTEGFINNGYIKASDGSLTAIGTAAEPIVFTSARAEKNAGDWAGLLVYDNSILRHCVIEYAGGDYTISGYTRALTLGGTAVIEDCLIQESSGTGMEISGGSATIRNNTIKNCADMGIEIEMQYHQIVDASNTLENTGGFKISGGGGMNTDVTLTKRAYPYVLSGTGIYADATLTIEPGTAIQMRSGSSISMGWNNVSNTYSGNLVANGTVDQPITFSLYTKDKEAGKNNWGSLFFAANSSTSVLNYCTFTDGGAPVDGDLKTYPDAAIINCYQTSGFPTITNCTISNSATYGIALISGATVNASNNTFSNNASGETLIK